MRTKAAARAKEHLAPATKAAATRVKNPTNMTTATVKANMVPAVKAAATTTGNMTIMTATTVKAAMTIPVIMR